jgi:uncharacterized protein (DUF1778 family)
MLASQADEALRGSRTARMEQRTTQEAKEMIEQAAYLLGINASEFTVAAAARAARATLNEYATTVISPADHDAFLKAWDATEPSADLSALMKLRVK